MIISEICIKRPVFATVLSLLAILIGLISFNKLDIRGAPDIDPPIITVSSKYTGASAEYMEKNVTNIVEQAMRTIKNVDYITSYSSIGSSKINIFFKLDADINSALSDVRSQIAAVSFNLPTGMQTPQASKQDSDNSPSIFLIVESSKFNALDLTYIVQKQVTLQLERIDSVGSAVIHGGQYYTIKVNVDPVALYKYQINLPDLISIINSQNTDYPSGLIKTEKLNFIVNVNSRITKPEDFANIVLSNNNGRIIKLSDVAKIDFDAAELDSILRCNGSRAVAIGLIKQSKANVLDLSKQVQRALPVIQKSLPDGIDIKIRYDQSIPVNDSIKSVFRAMFESVILVFLVVFLFLGSMRITLIPFVTIPVSLIATFGVMHFFGFSINTFSMLAMVLAIGLVVDDAIVVLENTYRYVEKGMDSFSASLISVKEISFVIIAMTTTLASVFLPIGFMEGFVGKLFIEFAWTLAFCVIISGFVALTLTPMMCSKIIKPINQESQNFILNKFAKFISYLQERYINLLKLSYIHKKFFTAICLFSLLVSGFCVAFVNKNFLPLEDDGFMQMFFTTPQGFSLKQSDKAIVDAQKIIPKNKNVENFIARTGTGQGYGFVILKDWSKREESQAQIRAQINKELTQITSASMFLGNVPSILSGPIQKAVEFNLQSINGDIAQLNSSADRLIEYLRSSKDLSNIEKDLKNSTPGINLLINKDKAQNYGVSLLNIGNTLTYMLALQNVSYFLMNDLIYNVIVSLGAQDRHDINDLGKIYFKSSSGNMIPLLSFTNVEEAATVQSYNHYNNVRAITITADLGDKASLANVAKAIEKASKNIINPNKIKMEFLGNLKRMKEQSNSMLSVFFIAIFFIYLILAAQFESFKEPLLILFSVPFSIVGAIFSLWLFDNSLNLYSNIGIITLIGLITKNAIMIIEFANQLREGGKDAIESSIEAAQIRFRPILMTNIATALGALPLILASGGGAAARTSIGLVIFGGISIGTIFTLFVIPFLYSQINFLRSNKK